MNVEFSPSPAVRLGGVTGAGERSWVAGAACRGMDTGLFFPVDDRPRAAESALAVCRRCRVRGICLVEALLVEDPARRYCVVGATTPAERDRLHRTARVAARREAGAAVTSMPGRAAA
ncbi:MULTISPECIES: WhiB family transcriptional regulator [unclassified Pseudonocardia]|uniref:WhiB family transcriptional regulator n=1 Tax=unclassified Pseudonocardia TaxID=2619320 RepID=UPI0009F9B3CB|nr:MULTISPECIES: WhiB family transcriptional regulator [unclassified Pseudonocardia]